MRQRTSHDGQQIMRVHRRVSGSVRSSPKAATRTSAEPSVSSSPALSFRCVTISAKFRCFLCWDAPNISFFHGRSAEDNRPCSPRLANTCLPTGPGAVPLLPLHSEGDAHRRGWDSMIQPSRSRHSRCVIVSRSSVGSYNMRHRFRRGLPRSDGNLSELPDGLPIKTSQ